MKPGSLTIALFLLCSFTACRPGPEVSEQGSISASAPAPATTSAANPETAATAVPETASTTATPGNSGPSLSTDAPGRISEQEQDALAPPTLYGYRVVRSYPHDPEAFTQGFTYHEGLFYEGTGLEGASSLRVVRPETGEVLKLHQLPPDIFGEGITLAGDRIVQVSWKNQQAFIYDRQTLKPIQRLRYAMAEGWGITYDGPRLIMSDGSATLYFLHPATCLKPAASPSGNRGSQLTGSMNWSTFRERSGPTSGGVTIWSASSLPPGGSPVASN
jgi:hypothetical protein